MAGVERFLERRLKLKVNRAKSAVARPSARKFLGFSFTSGAIPRRRIAPETLVRLKQRVRETTRRTRGRSLEQIIAELARYLNGWRGYFGFCETPSVLRDLDQWVRRRLRAIAWKQWKRGRTRFAELTRRGIGQDLAAQSARQPQRSLAHEQQPRARHGAAQCYPRIAQPALPRPQTGRIIMPNRRIRARTCGGVGGAEPRGSPLSRLVRPAWAST
jgi:group II intron maturase